MSKLLRALHAAIRRRATDLQRPRPVIVQTYRIKATDLQKRRQATHARLAAELGRDNPVRT